MIKIFNINAGIKNAYRRAKDFFVKPRTYKGLQKFGCSEFIDKYGSKDFKKLVRKGIKKKKYFLWSSSGAGVYGLKLGWITRVNSDDWCTAIPPKEIDMDQIKEIMDTDHFKKAIS